MCAAYISSINQHCFEGERGMLIKQSKKYCKCSRLLAEIVAAFKNGISVLLTITYGVFLCLLLT